MPADARDGCGRGLYFDGYRCVPQYYAPPPPQVYYGGPGYVEPGYRRGYRSDWNDPNSNRGCPYSWTRQDGVCKPYTGR